MYDLILLVFNDGSTSICLVSKTIPTTQHTERYFRNGLDSNIFIKRKKSKISQQKV